MLTALTSGGRALLNLLQSQLAFYGAIDDAVVHAQQGGGENSDEVRSTVEAMLPGTTGFGQAGWYRELEDFANRPGVRSSDVPVTFPSFTDSLAYLAAPTAASREQVAVAAFQGDLDPEREKLAEHVGGSYYPNGDPVLARCAYAAMVLEQIAQLGGLPPTLATQQDAPARIMAYAINAWRGSTKKLTDQAVKSNKRIQRLLDQADADAVHAVHTRDDWHSLAAKEVNKEFADQSLPCFGTLVDVNGQYCSTIYTDATDDKLSVDDIEKIIDPANWSLCCKFFCNVAVQAPPYTPRGWSRMLETIGPDCSEWCLKTALVFYYGSDSGNGSIFINYDLDPNRQNDSGLVEVDNGYIWITPKDGTNASQPGVRIRTSKQERVQGLSPTATSALGCLLGWGNAAYELLGGTAKKIVDGTISANLQPFQETPPAGYQSQTDSGGAQPPGADARPTLPPNFADAVKDARDLLNNLINRTRDVTVDAANRWIDGMTREDVKEITEGIGTNLEQFALDVYQTAENDVKPQVTKAN
jgi:hypothetical protein